MKDNTGKGRGFLYVAIGIVAVAVLLAVILWLTTLGGNKAEQHGYIVTQGTLRRGNTITLEYKLSEQVLEHEVVSWYVNGQIVQKQNNGQKLVLEYTPNCSDNITFTAKVGNKYYCSKSIQVLPPQLTLTAKSYVITYGEQCPNLQYDCCGLVDKDTPSDLQFDGCVVNCDNLDVGVYQVQFDEQLHYKDYTTIYNTGTLTVLPKPLSLRCDDSKMYDGTNILCNANISLEGILEGDDVYVDCQELLLQSKNVGSWQVVTANITLQGEDAHNYVLQDTPTVRITPKPLTLSGLEILDKIYDGTTKATIKKMGKLEGVIEGDSVAIGKLELSFLSANTGNQSVTVEEACLVGADKGNYQLTEISTNQGKISGDFWDKILNKQPLALG